MYHVAEPFLQGNAAAQELSTASLQPTHKLPQVKFDLKIASLLFSQDRIMFHYETDTLRMRLTPLLPLYF